MAPPPWRFDEAHAPFEANASKDVRRWAALEAKSDTTRDDLLREADPPRPERRAHRHAVTAVVVKLAVWISRGFLSD